MHAYAYTLDGEGSTGGLQGKCASDADGRCPAEDFGKEHPAKATRLTTTLTVFGQP